MCQEELAFWSLVVKQDFRAEMWGQMHSTCCFHWVLMDPLWWALSQSQLCLTWHCPRLGKLSSPGWDMPWNQRNREMIVSMFFENKWESDRKDAEDFKPRKCGELLFFCREVSNEGSEWERSRARLETFEQAGSSRQKGRLWEEASWWEEES